MSYASVWAENFKKTGDSSAANAAANLAIYGNASGPTNEAQRQQALAGTGFANSSNTNKLTSNQSSNSNKNASSGSSGGSSNQSYFAGQRALEDSLSRLSSLYSPRSQADMQSEAQNWADMQVNPQITSLQASLQKAISDAAGQKQMVEANYSTIGSTAERLLADAQKQGTLSAVARGGGRSGAVEYEVGKLREPINDSVIQAENQRAASLTAIDNALAAVNENYSSGLQSLEKQRGILAASQLAALQRGDTELANDLAYKQVALEFELASMMDSRDRWNADSARADIELTGQAQGITGTMGLTDFLTSNGYSAPEWDANTGNVTVNGKTYTAKQLEEYGEIQNGRWQLPESVIRSML